jgi:hypothetical protein
MKGEHYLNLTVEEMASSLAHLSIRASLSHSQRVR